VTHQLFQPSSVLTFDTVLMDSQRLLKCVSDHHVTSLCILLEGVQECDSAGLALLIEAKRLCQRFHKCLTFEGMPVSIAALAEFCGVDQMLRNEWVEKVC
jgi:phospholipid transport system transporter-binding protein